MYDRSIKNVYNNNIAQYKNNIVFRPWILNSDDLDQTETSKGREQMDSDDFQLIKMKRTKYLNEHK